MAEQINLSEKQQTDWALNIKRIRDIYDYGIFEAETRGLKLNLLPITERAINGMKDILLRIFHIQVLELKEIYQNKIFFKS